MTPKTFRDLKQVSEPPADRKQVSGNRPPPAMAAKSSGTSCSVGPGGAGKTMLTEAILAATGAVTRPGSVENGNTVSDFEDVERRLGPVGVARRGQHAWSTGPGRAAAGRAARSGSTWSTRPATPTSSASCAPACGPRTPRCSSSPRRRRPPADASIDGGTRMLWQECADGRHAARGRRHAHRPAAWRLRRGGGELPARVR